MLTFVPLDEIARLEKLEGAQLNEAKEVLAFETTKLVHGEIEASKARQASRALFGGGSSRDDIPTSTFTEDDFAGGSINILDLLVKANLAPSKSEARRNVEQGGVCVDGEKVTDTDMSVSAEEIANKGELILKRGKKAFRRIVVK